MIRRLPINEVNRNPEQPRQFFDEEKLRELADSIDEIGLQQPIKVKPNGADYIIVHGERRWRACKLLELETIDAIVDGDLNDDDAYVASIVENEQREDLSAIETAKAIRRAMDEQGLTQSGVAKRIGKSRSWIAQKLRLLNLSEGVQSHVSNGKLAEGHARQLLKLRTAEKADRIEDLADRAVSESWSVSRLTSEVDVVIAGEPEADDLDTEDVLRLALLAGYRTALCHVTHSDSEIRYRDNVFGVSRDTLGAERG